MNDLPLRARIFLFAIFIAGIGSAIALFTFLPLPEFNGSIFELVVFVALSAAAGHRKVTLLRIGKGDEDSNHGSMSLGFAMIFATMLRFGPQGAVLAGFASTFASCIRPRQPWYQFLFNLSLNAIDTTIASVVFYKLNGESLYLQTWSVIPPVTAACLCFFFVNTGVVATIIGMCTNRSPFSIWRESFLWTAPSYFLGAGISTIASATVGNKMLATLLCAVPIGLLTHMSFRSYLQHAEGLISSKEELATLYLATIRSLALAIDAKDQYTHQHILRVQQYAVAIAEAMNIDGDELEAIRTGALLHDIGKLGVPEYVLLKPGRLTEEEYSKIKEHPSIGADILDPVKFPWPVLPVVKYHHERWDGSGYPEGLSGSSIPRTARILAVADVYDALTSSRSYRAAWSHERAIEDIKNNAGTHFDPDVVDVFLKVVDCVRERIYPDLHASDALPAATNAKEPPVTTPRSAEAVRHIQRSSSELWALYEVSQTLSASLGLDDTLEILGRKLLAIFPDTGCVFLLAEEQTPISSLHCRFAVGLNQAFFSHAITRTGDSLSMRVATGRQTYLGEFDIDDLISIDQNPAPSEWVGTALIVPIVHQGQALGTINLYHAEVDAFGSHVQHLLETIAQRAALPLYNGLMFERTRSHAITDPLTGLANVRCISEWMEERVQIVEESNRFALLCLDLDSFKPINDNFGHQKGDEVLKDLARLFKSAIREGDLVGRNGGDEFVVLLRDAGPQEATTMARRLQNIVTQYDPGLFHTRLGKLQIGVSIGAACFPYDGHNVATLLSVADAAMYENKTERKLKQLADPNRVENPRTLPNLPKLNEPSVAARP